MSSRKIRADGWVPVRFHSGKPPRQMGAEEVTAFRDELAVARRTAASTQNQALCARIFLYKRVLDLQIPRLEALERARRPEHLPSVLSRLDIRTIQTLLGHDDGRTTMIDTHIVDRGPLGVVSPLGR
ncbi:site-specific integrase [Sorangium sp. So ce185]|uniref:site-specific integrase n=1 Tax=Sorangium sp. So ce185 TaxID=3133287 RepID=UPI003F62707F